ncbi:M13 family metallopeptidase [Solirubrobacter sp. CPCC 204708]|uniref:M13 family metallopeptidase n=1 Tax=Solirubrobacter deserti TaxID=2282478 RepID=A0ABT4RNL7_9ACTN|nr:M13 family metallopeptidase [Solirubrobacter deserti]MBE2314917.1 M13 family metallopeptidase [Solirubrobacter deserti]MDA0140148.1 M13 family metallopeptidase [Solirubrobacter deserti]
MALLGSDRDPSADPGVDFYRFANGGWLDANPIPAGYGSWGAFEEVGRRNELALRELLERAAEAPADALDGLLGDAFAAGMDLEAIEAAGLEPIAPLLRAIEDDPAAALPALHRAGIFALFGWYVTVDHDDSGRYLLWLVQAGLGLRDRERYFDPADDAVALRAAYVEHIAAQLAHVGFDAARAADVLAFETRLAGLHLKAEERRDVDRTHNRRTPADVEEYAPGYLLAIGAGAAESVNVENPRLLEALPGVLAEVDPEVLGAYLAFTVVRTVANALPKRIDDEDFAFYGRRIRGQQEQHERGKRVIDAIGEDLGEALAQRYVALHFAPEAKERAAAMVAAILEEMRASIRTRDWMSAETKLRAEAKLDAMRVKIGYPDRPRDWSGLSLGRTTYAANRLRATRFELDRQLAKLTEPVDREEWEMPAHIVNAYYHPSLNEIVVPAGILQPPLFDAAADDAVNFGGIGMVTAHEVTHGFDDQGRRYDADGALREWWTPEDAERFKALADRLVAQFDAYTVLGDLPVNGRLTLGENIADLGGLALAQRAHARVSAGAPAVDGLTPAQRFFLSNATLWRANISPEYTRTLAGIDPHSPRSLRVLGPVSNLEAFREAFGLADDAPIMRPPGERIEIW